MLPQSSAGGVAVRPRSRGILLTGIGVLVLSPDSILIRLLGADVATTLFWRALAMAIGLFGFLIVRERGRLRPIASELVRPLSVALAVLFAISNILFVAAIEYAAVSDTLGCLATASVFAALFGALFLHERLPLRTWVAAAVIALGLLMIAFGGAGSGFGRAIGIATAAAFGATFVVMRAAGEGDTVPGLAASGVLVALVCVWPADIFTLSARGYATVAGLGVVLPLAFGLIGRGPRYLPAAEVSLLMLLETVFGTLWAWLFLAEAPTPTTLLAITIILATLAAFYGRQAQLARRGAVTA